MLKKGKKQDLFLDNYREMPQDSDIRVLTYTIIIHCFIRIYLKFNNSDR